MKQNLRYFSILAEVVVGTKDGNHLSDVLVRLGRRRDEVIYFFFGVLPSHASYINNVSLNDANIEILFSAKSFEISALFLLLLLLLSYPTITMKFDEKRACEFPRPERTLRQQPPSKLRPLRYILCDKQDRGH